mmetsp:Transcript_6320/g.12481  ORF Transcript_6320/g.12481 Transcript_6320/m.12481 type:complete len:186 (+) Transcript_6320:1233-1790(+)
MFISPRETLSSYASLIEEGVRGFWIWFGSDSSETRVPKEGAPAPNDDESSTSDSSDPGALVVLVVGGFEPPLRERPRGVNLEGVGGVEGKGGARAVVSEVYVINFEFDITSLNNPGGRSAGDESHTFGVVTREDGSEVMKGEKYGAREADGGSVKLINVSPSAKKVVVVVVEVGTSLGEAPACSD